MVPPQLKLPKYFFNWVYGNSKIIAFIFWFHIQYVFLFFSLVPFFKNRSYLCCFLFLVFFLLLCYSYTEQLKKRCTLWECNCVLLQHNKSLHVCLLLFFNSLHSVSSPLEEGCSRFSCKNEGLGGNPCKSFL